MKKYFILLLSIFALSETALVFAGDNDGTATAVFLRQEQGVRALGMGGAFVAMEKDAESIWWNPAGAANLDGLQINASYSDYISDLSGYYSAIAWPRGRNTILCSINYMSLGSIDGRDSVGYITNTLKLSNMIATIGYAMQTSPNMNLGFTVKNISQNLGDYKSSGFAADAGLLFKLSEIMSLGFCVQNIGPELETEGIKNKLPMDMRLGLAYQLSPKIIITAEGENPNDADLRFHGGGEMKMSDTFFIRAGYNSSDAVGLSVGLGVLTPINLKPKNSGDASSWWKEAVDKDWKHDVVRVDYAYISSGDFDATHRLSLTFKF